MTEKERNLLLKEREIYKVQLDEICMNGTYAEIERARSFNDGFDTALRILNIKGEER